MVNEDLLSKDFSAVSIHDINLIQSFLEKADYPESNHNIVNMMIWLDYYPLYKVVETNYLLLLGIHEGEFFIYMPLCEKQYAKEAIIKAKKIFDNYGCEFNLSCYTKEMMNIVLSLYPKYHACSRRSSLDYIHTTEQFRTFSGKKLQKKRNHLNAFYREYEGRYVYEPLDKENVVECGEFLNRWKPENKDIWVVNEKRGIQRVLKLFSTLNYQGGLIRVDGKVEAFLIVSTLNHEMVQENVEKANDEIRGLYQALSHQFFNHNYLEIKYLNREDDIGLENLRQAKLAYAPVYLLEKFWLCKGDEDASIC